MKNTGGNIFHYILLNVALNSVADVSIYLLQILRYFMCNLRYKFLKTTADIYFNVSTFT